MIFYRINTSAEGGKPLMSTDQDQPWSELWEYRQALAEAGHNPRGIWMEQLHVPDYLGINWTVVERP